MNLEKYGFKLTANDNGIKEYRFTIGKKEFIEVVCFNDIFSINYYFEKQKLVIANRYRCENDSDLKFLLLNGRVGDFLQGEDDSPKVN